MYLTLRPSHNTGQIFDRLKLYSHRTTLKQMKNLDILAFQSLWLSKHTLRAVVSPGLTLPVASDGETTARRVVQTEQKKKKWTVQCEHSLIQLKLQ